MYRFSYKGMSCVVKEKGNMKKLEHEQSKKVLSQREKKRIENRREDLKDGTMTGTDSDVTNYTVGYG